MKSEHKKTCPGASLTMQSRQNRFADTTLMTFHSQLDAWNDLLQALVFGLQAEILPAPLIVAMPPMLGLDAAAAAAALDAEGAEHLAAADTALLTSRLFSMLFLLEWGEILRLQWKRPWNAALSPLISTTNKNEGER